MTERHRRLLAELAELGAEQARAIHEDFKAAETPAERDAANAAFHRACRSVRQSLALEARLEREQRLSALRVARAAREEAALRGLHRRKEVQKQVRRMIFTEADPSEVGAIYADLDDLLEDAEYAEGFADGPIEAQIAAIRTQLGLDPAGAGAGADAAQHANRRAILTGPDAATGFRWLGLTSRVKLNFVDPPERSWSEVPIDPAPPRPPDDSG